MGAGGLGWRTVGALDQGCAQGNRAWGWPPEQSLPLPWAGGWGLLSPKTILSSNKEDSGKRHTPTHTPMHTHPTQKVLRTAALGSSESAGPSNTARDLGACQAPGDPMPTVAYFLRKLALPTRGCRGSS